VDGNGGKSGIRQEQVQNGAEFPITTITAKGSNLKLDVRTVGGSYDGDLKDGALVGQWTQGGRTLPLTFKRASK
jgi:hypothetical protein